ncbi:G-protein coupled receptor 54-like [Diretmus argenteus]
MALHPKKCKVMHFLSAKSHPPLPKLTINDLELQKVSTLKILGIHIQSNLKWSQQVVHLCKKASQRLFLLRRLKNSAIPPDELTSIFTIYIRPTLEYAAPVWHSGLTGVQSKAIERVQRRAVRIILGRDFTTYRDACSRLGHPLLSSRREDLTRAFATSLRRSDQFRSWLPPERGKISQRLTRSSRNLDLAHCNTERDIIFLVCCVPFTATLYPLPGWIFGDFMCKFVAFLQQVTVQATCITLTAMSGDRCYITIYPLKSLRHRTPRVAMIVSICIWIGSFILSIPIFMYQRIEEGYWYGPRQYCMERFPSKTHERAFILYQFIAAYLLPVLTISFCYTLMVKRVGQPTVEPVDNNYQVNLLSERTISIRSKVSKMVVVIVLLFTVCWGPIQFFILFQSFYPNYRPNYATYKIKTWANCMSYTNSSVNPIVYGFMGASFRKSFKKTFPFLFKHKVRDASMASRTANAEIKFVAAEEGNNNNNGVN